MMNPSILLLAATFLCTTITARKAGSDNPLKTGNEVERNYIVLNNKETIINQMIYKNATYEIRDTFNVESTLSIPDNCLLLFMGGFITGSGRIEGNNTRIEAKLVGIFDDNIKLSGSWNLERAYCEWFGGSVSCEDNSNPIQKCIEAFNMLTLSSGTYRISKTIIVTQDGCLITGVSRNRSVIQKTSKTTEAINAIINISKSREKNIQHITMRDLKLSSTHYDVDYGIYSDGINSSEFRNLHIFQCKNGFYCKNETHGALWNLIFDNIELNCNTLRAYPGINHYGYKEGESCGVTCITNGGAGVYFNKCWSRDCSKGYHLKGLAYSQLNCCGADNIHGSAYLVEFCTLTMNSCGMENIIATVAVCLYQSRVTMNCFEDYKIITNGSNEAYRVKIDGGKASLINCHFTEWENKAKTPHVYGVTSNNGANVILQNSSQPKEIQDVTPLNGATLKIYD